MTENGTEGLLIRNASREDIPGLEEISRLTWDGFDYLDRVADDWIADGSLSTGIFQGRVAACARYTRIPGDVLWLEGLRVHPDFRGRGFGRAISEHVLGTCRGMLETGEARGIEFSTYLLNAESRGLGEKQGFRVAEWFHILFREGMPACHCRVEPYEPSPEDFSVYPDRVRWGGSTRVGGNQGSWTGSGPSPGLAHRERSCLPHQPARRRGVSPGPRPSWIRRLFRRPQSYASMHGRTGMELFLQDSHREMLAAAKRHGWGTGRTPTARMFRSTDTRRENEKHAVRGSARRCPGPGGTGGPHPGPVPERRGGHRVGALYTTEVRLNSGELPYPGSGIFSRTVTFYWSAEPWATPAHRLVKALVSWEVSAVTGDDDTFSTGTAAVFCLRTGGLDELEQRFYYSDGRLIRFMTRPTRTTPGPRLGEEPLNEGETLKQAFLLLH
jgi:GNAT superfamily N-acetyltransferase